MGRKTSFIIAIALVFSLIAYPVVSSAKKPPKPDKPNQSQTGGNNGNHYGWENWNKPPDDESSPGSNNGDGEGPTYIPNKCAWLAGDSHVGHLYLYQEDPATGEIPKKGAWGKLRYNVYDTTFKFVFNGHKLVPGQEYSLIYFPEPFPGEGLICLGSGTAKRGGNVHIMNMKEGVDTCSLPAESDANFADGALILLVPSEDVVCDEEMVEWIPEDYLFGCDFITFEDLDGCGDEPEDAFIDIQKATNGDDADEPTGPVLPVGALVEWTYEVTNTGTETLDNITVTDDQGVVVSCPFEELAPGSSMECTATGEAIEGQYCNVGTVVATLPDGTEVSDSDPSHYLGVLDSIEVNRVP